MSNEQTHIIQRQTFEADMPEGLEHWQWQERLSRFSRERFLPKLSALLDRLAPPDEVVRIEKLELTADLTDGEHWETMLLDSLLRNAEASLAQALATANPAGNATPAAHNGTPATAKQPAGEHVLEQFFFFLKTGRLPWQATASVRQDLEGAVLAILKKNKTAISSRRVEEFREMLRSEQVRRRLAGQFSASFLMKLATVFLPEKTAQIAESKRFALEISKQAGFPAGEMEAVFWQLVFEEAAGILTPSLPLAAGAEHPFFQKILLRFLTEKPAKAGAILRAAFQPATKDGTAPAADWTAPVRKLLKALQPQASLAKALADWLGSRPSNAAALATLSTRQVEILIKKRPDLTPAGLVKWLDETTGQTAPATLPADEPPVQAPVFPAAGVEEIYVDNAGLVLLHPFLPAFFEELKVVKNGRMAKPERAVHLLQFLATGLSATPEFELPLNKLLCGLPLDGPLTRKIRLTKKEKNEAESLLDAVVRHWSVLKNTSAEGLQGTFLCRAGKLSRRGSEDWQLQVEQKGFDVLLADLPWSISMIKLPWMQGMLWVEWQ